MSKIMLPVVFVFSILYMTSSVSCTRDSSNCKDKHPIAEAISNPRSLVDRYLDRYVPSFGTESLRNRRDHRDKLLTVVSDEAEKNYALIADSLNRGNKRKHGQIGTGYAPVAGGVKNEGGYGGGGHMPGYGNEGGGYGGNGGGGYGDGGSYPEPSPGYGGGSGYDDPMIGHGNPAGGKGHNNKGGGAGGYGSEEEFGTGYADNPEPRAPENPGGYGSTSAANGKFVVDEKDKRIHTG